ncbi:MAG: serine hydrolase [Cyanobacteria bacterium P01_B01_bin.77]
MPIAQQERSFFVLITNSTDFTRFIKAIIRGELLSRSSYEELFRVQSKPAEGHAYQNEEGTLSWGLGWVREDSEHGLIYQHGGNNGDFTCYFELSLDEEWGYVFFTNSDKGEPIRDLLRPLLFDGVGDLTAFELPGIDRLSVNDWSVAGQFDHLQILTEEDLCLYPDAQATLEEKQYQNMIIEFDVLMREGEGAAGINFRQKNPRNYETFYLSVGESATANAMQYTPVFNGHFGWQLYHGSNYNRTAYLRADDWVHVKMVILGDWMEVYLHNAPQHALHVFDLKHPVQPGDITLWSEVPACFANFSVSEISTYDFHYDRLPKPSPPPGTILQWEVSQDFGDFATALASMTTELNTWNTIGVEYNGLLNLGRLHVESNTGNCAIAKVNIYSELAQTKALQFGYSDEVQVFLNGKKIFTGDRTAFYRDAQDWAKIRQDDTIYLDLEAGENELSFIVQEYFGGWGIMARFPDPEGLQLAGE